MKLNNVVMPSFSAGLFYYTLLTPRETFVRRTEIKIVCLFESKMKQLENSFALINVESLYIACRKLSSKDIKSRVINCKQPIKDVKAIRDHVSLALKDGT